MNTKKPTRAQRVAKVKRALKKYVAWNGDKPLTVQKVVQIGSFSDVVFFYLGDGAFTIFKQPSLAGVIGGYNRCAMSAVDGLQKVRVISAGDLNAFFWWWRRQEKKNTEESEIAQAHHLAEKHGYRLHKKPTRAAA